MIRCPECSALVPNDTWPCACGFKFVGDEPELFPDPVAPAAAAEVPAEDTALLAFLPVRSRLAWAILPVACYFLSFLWFDVEIAVKAFPFVILEAPLGLLTLFGGISHAGDDRMFTACFVVHAIFWPSFFYGFGNAGNRKVSLSVLRAIYVVIVIVLALTMYGCARNFHLHSRDLN